MKIFENYNTAKQKYGIKMVQNFINLGLPPQYLLSACRFYNKLSLTPSEIVSKFRDWTKFVIKYQKYDVNKLTYNKFIELIENGKTNHLIPNILIKTDNAILGEINSPKDIENFSNENNWCIVSKKKFDTYVQKYGYKFFVIFMPKEPRPLTYVIVAIHDGEVEYWDENNFPHNDLNQDNDYEKKLSLQIVNYLYNIAAKQGELRDNINETKEEIIKITETQINKIIYDVLRKYYK